MKIGSYLAIYFVIWWTVLFAVLPFGVKTVEATEPGHDAGAPVAPLLVKKSIATTLISAVLMLVFWWLISSGIIDITAIPFFDRIGN
jgi:predicted secreted protein